MDRYEATDRLVEILDEARELGYEARELMREYFPELANQGDAYGAFTFGTSANRYDITLERLIQSTEAYDEEEV